MAFLDSNDFESAIRLAVSIGGDSDTVACITGGIAEAFYKKIPESLIITTKPILGNDLWSVVRDFYINYVNYPEIKKLIIEL